MGQDPGLQTTAYDYSLSGANGRELWSMHWHPNAPNGQQSLTRTFISALCLGELIRRRADYWSNM